MADIPFTDEQLRTWARKVIEGVIEDGDFWEYAGDIFGAYGSEEWSDLDGATFRAVQDRVAELAATATITITWDDEPTAQEGGTRG